MLGHGGVASTGVVAETAGAQTTFILQVTTATFAVATNPVLFQIQLLETVQAYTVTTVSVVFRVSLLETVQTYTVATSAVGGLLPLTVTPANYVVTTYPVRDLNDYPSILIRGGGWQPAQPHPGDNVALERRAKAKEAEAERQAKAKRDKQAQLALKRKKAKQEAEKQAQFRSEAEARAREEFERRKSQFPPPAGQLPFGTEVPLESLGIPGLGQVPVGLPTGMPLDHYGAMIDEVQDMQDALMAIHAINAQITEMRDVQDALLAISIVQPR